MKIFTAIVTDRISAFEPAVEKAFPGNSFKVSTNVWLIASNGTAQEVCAALGMPTKEDENTSPFSAIITGVSGYYGFASAPVWEWMTAKQAADG